MNLLPLEAKLLDSLLFAASVLQATSVPIAKAFTDAHRRNQQNQQKPGKRLTHPPADRKSPVMNPTQKQLIPSGADVVLTWPTDFAGFTL